ncbi:MAG: sortase [Clostridia bacterium]|nr:sortase [Clostridia bacterium]
MTANKYGNMLTIILIVLIVAILIGAGLLVYNYVIKPNVEDDRTIEAIEEFDRNTGNEEEQEPVQDDEENDTTTITPDQSTGSTSTGDKKTYYNGFVMIGYITIPKTNVKEPILDTVTPDSLNTAVATLYPSNPKLNNPGNVVIIGHNYRNGKFFSNNNRLSVGDKILIKDTTGTELSYTIYQKFQTTEQDTSFYNRDTNGAIEITLSTCTDDSKARIIILAKADQ